jgi:hypothetical protein
MGITASVVVGIATAALGVLAAEPLAGTAAILPQLPAAAPGVLPPTVRSATVPALSLPTVTTPPVSTPVATVPSVTTPPVSTPPVSTPRVSVPVAAVPPVSAPPVSAPVATAPAHTLASTISSVAGGVTQRGQTSAAAREPAAAQGPAATPAAAPTATAQALRGPDSLAAPGTPATAAATPDVARRTRTALAEGQPGTRGHRSSRARRIAAARQSRRLRRLVARLRGCLGTLDVGAQRLLTLRAGLDGPARSAAATARILDIGARREARLERQSLAALTRSAMTGCARSKGAIAPAAPASNGTLNPSAPPPGGTPAPSGPSASLSAAHAVRPPQGGRGPTGLPPEPSTVQKAETGSSSASLFIAALLAFASVLVLLALPELRRRLRPAAAAVDAGGASRRATAPPRHRTLQVPEPRGTEGDALDQMAANIVAEMTRESLKPRPDREADDEPSPPSSSG